MGTIITPPGGMKQYTLGGNDTAMVAVFELPVNTPIPVRIHYSIGCSAIYLQGYKISYDSVAISASNKASRLQGFTGRVSSFLQ